MDAALQVWKDTQIAFETKHEDHVSEITNFVLMQPECAVVPGRRAARPGGPVRSCGDARVR
eukprot:5206661-Prymnesium_polylepis.1